MDALGIRLRTKFIQFGLQIIVLLQLTEYLWLDDTPISEIAICYDYIIVGCGTAGSIIANRLTASGEYTVLVIESGDDPPIESLYPATATYLVESPYDCNFTTLSDGFTAKGHRNHILQLTSGCMVGGDSSLGHMLYIRGHPHDFNTWARIIKDALWNYINLLPYFKKSENLQDKYIIDSYTGKFHGTHGNMGVMKHHKDINRKYLHGLKDSGNCILKDGNGDKTLGYFEPMVMVKDGIRQSMPYTFLRKIKHRSNLHLLKKTEVIEINIDGNVSVGVTAIKNNKVIKIRAVREVIVAAGTFKSPQLLMLSGIGGKDHLESHNISVKADLPVGKNYQDHLSVVIVNKFNITSKKSPPPNPHEYPIPIIIGNVALDESVSYPEYQTLNYVIPSDSDSLLSQCSVTNSFNDEICQSLYNKTKGHEAIFTKIVLLRPKSTGYIYLQSKDYRDDPLIIPRFFYHDEDLNAMLKYIHHFINVTQTSFGKLGIELVHPKLEACKGFHGNSYWRCYILYMMATTYHYTSSCSMGKVVDNRLRVYGFERLRIIDASVMPLIPSGTTQAATMAIAEKGSDMILEDALPPLLCPVSNC